MLNILGQIFGIIGFILAFLTYIMKTQTKILIVMSLFIFFNAVSYACLGAWIGCAVNCVAILRNVVFALKPKYKFFSSNIWTYVFMVLIGSSLFLEEITYFTPILMCAYLANTYILSLNRSNLLRASILFTSSIIIVYDCIHFTLGGILAESCGIISSIIGLILYSKKKGENKNER